MFGPSISAAYAIQALAYLARQAGWVRGAGAMSSAAGIPRPYLVKLLHALAHEGLVVTRRGYRGGYRLAANPEDVTLFDVVTAVDGPNAFERCLIGLGRCSPKRECPVHALWSRERPRIKKRFRELTLREAASFEGWGLEPDYRFGVHAASAFVKRARKGEGGDAT